jgi:NAD(P)-dependent dehydrogenase (short-subunit alcohol dehydrogenase family)
VQTPVESLKYPEVVMPECQIPKSLKGQKALVTGASSGIGKAVAIALGQAGADVVVNYVDGEPAANEVAVTVSKSGARSLPIQADVSQEAQVQAMFARMLEEFGTIDILINNAGLQKDAPFEEMTLTQWNTVIGVNLTGQFLCAREVRVMIHTVVAHRQERGRKQRGGASGIRKSPKRSGDAPGRRRTRRVTLASEHAFSAGSIVVMVSSKP